MIPPIRVAGLSFAYDPGSPPVLDAVHWEVPAGAFVALLGPNGGGKTTLLRLLLGLLRPDAGSVELFGAPPRRTCHRVGYIPQRDAIDAHSPHTVLEVVLSGRLTRSPWGWRYGAEDHAAAQSALARVGLADRARDTLDRLSGGQRQRVRLARALSGEAELLLLDEPLTGVDPDGGDQLLDLLHELNRERTIVLVSHDLACVSRHASHVACCHRRVVMHPAAGLDAAALHAFYHSGTGCRVLRHHAGCCPVAGDGG
jgi:zinc transport system ATP-binding protein